MQIFTELLQVIPGSLPSFNSYLSHLVYRSLSISFPSRFLVTCNAKYKHSMAFDSYMLRHIVMYFLFVFKKQSVCVCSFSLDSKFNLTSAADYKDKENEDKTNTLKIV